MRRRKRVTGIMTAILMAGSHGRVQRTGWKAGGAHQLENSRTKETVQETVQETELAKSPPILRLRRNTAFS